MHIDTSDSIGITTTIPAEIVYAAGRRITDLNNLFVQDDDPASLVAIAEQRGFPQNICTWVKGIYGAIHKYGIREIVGVVEGDCSETGALLDILQSEGLTIHPFGYPHSREPEDLEREMTRLADSLDTTLDAAREMKPHLDHVRVRALDIDVLAFKQGCVSSKDLFSSLLVTSDFNGDPRQCADDLLTFGKELQGKTCSCNKIRLGCVGVPTIYSDLWEAFDRAGGHFVYHEIPRQFALPDGIDKDLTTAYLEYTYPYDFFHRLRDIEACVEERGLHGIVHYVQSFCHRQMHDRLLRERLTVPVLTIEGDRPGPVDERTRTRIEAFLEQLAG